MCSVLLLRHQAVWSPPLFTACVCDLRRVRVLVRLSHPRPPDRNQHGCTVGVLPGPTRVLPMPRQYGIGRRAPTRAVLSCAALWCLVVYRPRRRVDCLVLTFCYVSSRKGSSSCRCSTTLIGHERIIEKEHCGAHTRQQSSQTSFDQVISYLLVLERSTIGGNSRTVHKVCGIQWQMKQLVTVFKESTNHPN